MRELLGASAAVDQPNNEGTTPLVMAVQNGDLEVVRALLAAGADRSYSFAFNGKQWTALKLAEAMEHDDNDGACQSPLGRHYH